MAKITKAITSLIICLTFISPLNAQTRHRTARGRDPQRSISVRPDPARELREKTFNRVWETVNEENFDPTFGGVNWVEVYSRYYPRLARVTTDQELYLLLQRMLDEIPQSHFAIIPPERIPKIRLKRKTAARPDGKDDEPNGDALGDEMEAEGDNAEATQMLNGIGVDVRILDGQVVITRVDQDGPAAKAGLRAGFIITRLDDLPLTRIPPTVDITPTMHIRLRQTVLVDYLGGEAGTDVNLAYLDAENKERRVTIKRERLRGTLSQAVGNLPPLYMELESRRLQSNVGYIRFSVFTPQLAEKLCAAIKSMRDTRGLVIDLRGNLGGVMGVASGVVGLLTSQVGLIGTLRLRTGSVALPTFPQKSSYNGPLVILVDRLSASTAEVMAANLQESKRALIVGEQSSGQVLGANIIRLPTGALFEYARAGFRTSQGATLEGTGVRPDVEKKLDRNLLLKGEDSQLDEAVRQIELQGQSAARKTSDGSLSEAPPPPPPPAAAPPPPASVTVNVGVEKGKDDPPPAFKSTPQAEQVMERYISAVGGREALARLKSRVSVGTCLYPFQGLTGKVTIYEEAPDRSSMEMEIPNLGTTKVVFDGKRGWVQNSLTGFYEYKEYMIPALRREFDFYRIIKYKELYSEIIYKGAFDSSDGKVDVLEVVAPNGARDELHFDTKTGLLVYGGGQKLGDYRQVGEVKVPYLLTMFVSGMELKIQLQEISHNTPVSADAFAEPHSCFTGQ